LERGKKNPVEKKGRGTKKIKKKKRALYLSEPSTAEREKESSESAPGWNEK